jgi:hypothetical protein
MARSTSVKTSCEPYEARQAARPQRGLAARRRLREAQLGDLVVGPLGLEAGEHRSARRAMFCAATVLVAFARILSAWAMSTGGLLLGVGPLALAAALVGLALQEVRLPAQVVLVELAAVGVEVEDLVDHGVEQLDVVRDDHEPPR